ncbi:TetR/AcrR family transcriptional regulator [Mycobacterium sp. 1245852.3]|uniref:TetR/AcrR family transcriptional regulator n=1 Tax=Mycobacterium sp. 1245852.3 TaxID=1856860 RepID=UPI003511969C
MPQTTMSGVSSECGPRRPLRKDAERNRQRVVEAARDLFASRGLEATLNDVAHHAGVGVGTVYRRFPTKESLVEAIFEDGIDEATALAESALQEKNSWRGFVGFFEQFCELTATDRGLREAVFSKAYGGDRVEASRLRLTPAISKLVERAKDDGYLRPDVSTTDMPFLALLAGTVSEYAGHVEPQLWRRYLAIFLDGLRPRRGQRPLAIAALDDEQLDAAMRTWYPATSG